MSRRNVTLYIDGKPADIATDSLILLNYAASDLSSPAAVKNTYSQQVNMPGTARNDAIFSSIYRADYRTIVGDVNSFNPLIRTPFTIYDETGAILESGYLKLNTVKNKNGVRTYIATLYGGLGSFFYTLAYDDEGEGLTLGALPLLSDDPEDKIEFPINKDEVAKAWDRLKKPTSANAVNRQYDAVNFAPAYNGLPEGEFDAGKGVGRPEYVGGDNQKTDDSGNLFKGYGTLGEALYDFGDDFTEWEVKDLRSYLQRPVVAVKALIEGIVRYAQARGFSVYLDPAFFHLQNPYYEKAWMTLSLLAGRSVSKMDEGTLQLEGISATGNWAAGSYSYLAVPLSPSLTAANNTVTLKCKPQVIFRATTSATTVWLNYNAGPVAVGSATGTVVFVQVQLLGQDGSILKESPIKVCLGNHVATAPSDLTAQELVDKAGLQGCIKRFNVDSTLYIGSATSTVYQTPSGSRAYYGFKEIGEVEVSAYGAVSARVIVEPRAMYMGSGTANRREIQLTKEQDLLCAQSDTATSTTVPRLFYITSWGGAIDGGTLTYESPSDQYRSGVRVTQEDLFSDTMSPLDFLLSYTKTFGLHYLYDTDRKRVQILTRNTLYGDRQTVDLQQRIDRSREIATTPIPMSAKWLEFAPASIEGEFAEYYKTKYGREYGIQKVNTGFDFDANTKQALDGTKFNGAPEVLERSKYFLSVYRKNEAQGRIPPPTIDGKTTYRLYRTNEEGKLEDMQIDYPNPTGPGFGGFDYMNENKGYDGVPKLQCHDDGNSSTDGAGILLFHRGLARDENIEAYLHFILTDDSATMYDLNEKPCWELTSGTPVFDILPSFGRFLMKKDTIQRSMEFGVPAEIDNPVIAVDKETSVYERFWAKYIADRNNVDTRVCTAYVDLRGFQPGPEMLRDFYYFDGAIWVLNKIANYSLTKPGTTQCEFVKVQDRANYASGQLLEKIEYYLTLNNASEDIALTVPYEGGKYRFAYSTNGTLKVDTEGVFGGTVNVEGGFIELVIDGNGTSANMVSSIVCSVEEDPTIVRKINITQEFFQQEDDITLKLRTDGTNLYVETSRPLAATERLVIGTCGHGRAAIYNHRDYHERYRNHFNSRRRWHIPFLNSNVRLYNDGRITVYANKLTLKWRLETSKKGVKYVHIYKANFSKNFGYKAVDGLNKAVTFSLSIYTRESKYKRLSNICYFESRCHYNGGVLTQEFAVTKTL